MGDLAESIAQRALTLVGQPDVPIPDTLQRMTDLTLVMIRQVLDAFVRQDAEQARAVLRLDDEVDGHCAALIAEAVAYMRPGGATVEPGLALFGAARNLERIADHATNIAEDVIYLVEGEIVRHQQG
jgi:phosphate transport system protein